MQSKGHHLAAIELLLDNGADIEARSVGSTALECAFQFMHQPCIQLLLEKVADISAVDLSVVSLSQAILFHK